MNRANAANWSSFTHDAVVRAPWHVKLHRRLFAMGKFRPALGR